MDLQVRNDLREFIVTSFLFGDATRLPDDDASLIEDGIVDSTGVLELIEYLAEHFGVDVADTEAVPGNLGSITNLTRVLTEKLAVTAQ